MHWLCCCQQQAVRRCGFWVEFQQLHSWACSHSSQQQQLCSEAVSYAMGWRGLGSELAAVIRAEHAADCASALPGTALGVAPVGVALVAGDLLC
jgi:hypothetical protein